HHDDTILEVVHDPEMVSYMRDAHQVWVSQGYLNDPGQPQVSAYAFPTERFLDGLPLRAPTSPAALAGVYAMDTMTQIGVGTFQGARAAVDMALTAAELVLEGGDSAYAACRPPGHHAGRNFFGGACYLNNAAIAAESLRTGGFSSVTIIDLDAHHGNGTQQIFYERDDVAYGSVHVDPAAGWFPHFIGHGDESGRGIGEGANLNLPLQPETPDDQWLEGVDRLVGFAKEREASAIVVSLGVDAAISDPNSPLRITESGYRSAGERIASLDLPTVFIQEGGYVPTTIGGLVSATLNGFDMERGELQE
ncbi:MAG: histone deacetylase family protein, partial [Acidimicrobiia bacterium]